MIAKIGRGVNMMGALYYNLHKVNKENGQIIDTQRIMETPDGRYKTAQLYRSFEPYFMANKRTEKPVLHISLNPDPADRVSDAQFIEMAREYMGHMGYGEQPYIVFKHTDIDRIHIHIVSTCVDRYGKKIPDKYEKLRSMEVCRALEQKYNLIPAIEKQQTGNKQVFRPVDYKAGDIKSQIASVVRHLPKYYGYPSLGTYNALLSLFNITAEEVKGELHGQPKSGLVYFALNEQREKASNPFKASLFGKQAGLDELQKQFAEAKEKMKTDPTRAVLKNTIEIALHTTTGETDFKKQLLEQGISTVVRHNDGGRIYGMTFIDHESRTVWNGSALGKNLSANFFNDLWNGQTVEQHQETEKTNVQSISSLINDSTKVEKDETYSLFDFLNREQPDNDFELIDGLGSLLPETHGEDYEELAFANRMKKKRKKLKKF